MSHQMHDSAMTAAEALAAARELSRDDLGDADEPGGRDTSYDEGRAVVQEYVEAMDGRVAHIRAQRLLVEVGRREPGTRPAPGASQAVGRTLAAHARGDTPDDYLPHVDVSMWSDVTDGGPTTWTVEVRDG